MENNTAAVGMGTEEQVTFARAEQKFLLSPSQYEAFRTVADRYMKPDIYPQYTVLSIYYDTPDLELIGRSVDRPVYKEKLRLRSYGTPLADTTVFVEVKKKCCGIVYKRREPMALSQAKRYLATGRDESPHSQIQKEIDYFLSFYGNLGPAVLISYERTALAGIDDPAVRITFDQDMRWRTDDLALEHGDRGDPLLPDLQQMILMEAKFGDAMPLWMSHTLGLLGAKRTPFSKVGICYTDFLRCHKNSVPGGIHCA